jgi:hypothetical protein
MNSELRFFDPRAPCPVRSIAPESAFSGRPVGLTFAVEKILTGLRGERCYQCKATTPARPSSSRIILPTMKIALLTLAAVLGSFCSVLASSPSSCPPGGTCASCVCGEIKSAEGETVAAAQKRVMATELTRLVARYVADAAIRSELLRTLKSDPARALDFVALAKAAFSETDRACFKRVSEHFNC